MMNVNNKDMFVEEYAKLNEKQREAVDTLDGPVMVIAGPGTGKTQILSRRVANILVKDLAQPEEIVCLTYTNSGSDEMLDRLEKLLGEQGRKVRVSTIHGFCSSLILDNPDLFGQQPKLISTAVKYQMLKEVMDQQMKEDDILYKRSGERYSSREQLLDLFSRMKRQSLDKADIKREVGDYLEAIVASKEGDDLYKKFKYQRKQKENVKGDLKLKEFDKEKSKFPKLLSGSEVVEAYRENLSEQNYFDYDDMILWTKEKLEKNPDFQKTVAEGIKYLFVDEFQDTSVLQNELIDLLVAGKTRPNIFVVGDDDQSIYRFQGVSERNIEDFDKKYSPLLIVLEENYRSSQAIIDAAKELISRNPRREKALRAAGANQSYTQKHPALTAYDTEEAEMLGVLNEVKSLIADGVSPKEIGVIYGRNTYGKKLAQVFQTHGLPVHMEKEEDLFSDAFFKKLHLLLSYISRPSRHLKVLRKLLYLDFFAVPIDDLMQIRQAKEMSDISSPVILACDAKLEKLRYQILKAKPYQSPIYLLQQVVKAFELDTYIMTSKEKHHLVLVLQTFYDLMVGELERRPQSSLSDFLETLSSLKEMRVELPINRSVASPDNGVQLMTAHKSKGLEFDHVFMVKCNDGVKGVKWPGGEKTNHFSLPPSLDGKVANEKALKEEENRRLFYVGMTRAKKELHLSYNLTTKRTRFIDELEGHLIEKVPQADLDKDFSVRVSLPSLDEAVVRDTFSPAQFSLSVSNLNKFLKCPLSLYFDKVLQLPSDSNEALTFGTIIHNTLEGLYSSHEGDREVLSEKALSSKEEALNHFEEQFARDSWKLPSDRARRDDYARGLAMIDRFYEAEGFLKSGRVALEKTITGIKLADIKNTTVDLSAVGDFEINGKIDKIEVDGDSIRVIDYKTGKAENAKAKLNKPSEESPAGEEYWRQAVFYYILVTNSDLELEGKDVAIQYVFVEDENDPRGFSTTEVVVSEQDVNTVLEQVRDTLLALQAGEVTEGCGTIETKYPCDYCTFASLNSEPLLDNSPALEEASYRAAVKDFKSLSVSTLNRFLDCSNSFYFDQVLRLTPLAGLKPAVKTYKEKVKVNHAPTGPVFGTVMHETMECIYKDSLGLKAALDAFDNALAVHERDIIDSMNAKEMTTYGHKLLKNLFKHYIPNSCQTVELEKEIDLKLENHLPIKGIIDKLEYDGDTIRVVDYKTGTAQHGMEELETGGHYWRQAVFYHLLLTLSSIDTSDKKLETQYIFLDDDSSAMGYSLHTVEISEADLELVKGQIEDFWKQIRTGDMGEGCRKKDCDFCRLGEYVNRDLFQIRG